MSSESAFWAIIHGGVFVALLVGIGARWLALWMARDALRHEIASRGGKPRLGSVGRESSGEFEHEAASLTVRMTPARGYGPLHSRTYLSVAGIPSERRLKVRPRQAWDSLRYWRSRERFKTGFARFDQAFTVLADGAGTVRLFLPPRAQLHLLWIKDLDFGALIEAELVDGEARVFARRLFYRRRSLARFLDVALVLLDMMTVSQTAGVDMLPLDCSLAEHHCALCGEPFSVEAAVFCAQCSTPHHLACWRFSRRCAIYGCGSLKWVNRLPASAASD